MPLFILIYSSLSILFEVEVLLLWDDRSVFCLSPAGDTPSSARLFDAILSGCIPVVVSDQLELPFEGILDHKEVNSCTFNNIAVPQ